MNHVHGIHPWTSLLLASELGFCQEEGAATGPQFRKKPFGLWPACPIPDAGPAAGVVVLPCPSRGGTSASVSVLLSPGTLGASSVGL